MKAGDLAYLEAAWGGCSSAKLPLPSRFPVHFQQSGGFSWKPAVVRDAAHVQPNARGRAGRAGRARHDFRGEIAELPAGKSHGHSRDRQPPTRVGVEGLAGQRGAGQESGSSPKGD